MRAADLFGQKITGHGGPFEITRDHQVEGRTLGAQKMARLSCLKSAEGRERGIGLALPTSECVPLALSVAQDEDTGRRCRHGRPPYRRYARRMATLRLFAQAREAAGTGRDSVPGSTVDEVVANATARYGTRFAELLPTCRIWLNGEAVHPSASVTDKDEVAVLPPVSGGCR